MKSTGYQGVRERENKDGSFTYVINYYDESGKKVQKTVGNSKKDKMSPAGANKIRKALVGEIKESKKLLKNSNASTNEYTIGQMTLDEVFEKYYSPLKRNLTSFKRSKERYYNKISPLVGKVKIKDLEDEHRMEILNYHSEDEETKLSSILTFLTIPQAMINILKDKDAFKRRNPFSFKRGTKPKQANTRRGGVLTFEELNKLREHIVIKYSNLKNFDQYLLWLDISITTGGRVNTILNIKSEDLEFNGAKGTVMLRENKTLTNVKAHLNPDLVQKLKIFKHENKGKNTKLFSISYDRLYKFMTPVFEELFNHRYDKTDVNYEYKKIVIHSLRHTFATLLVNKQNVNLIVVQKLMGHKKIETTAGYITTDEKEQEIAVINYINNLNNTNTIDDFMNS